MGGSKSSRKKKPTLLKLVTGNPGRRPINSSEPEPAAGEMVAPAWLDEDGLRKWSEVLQLCPWITPADADTLALYCDSYSHYRKAQRLSIKTPLVKSQEGRMIKNPAWTARNEAWLPTDFPPLLRYSRSIPRVPSTQTSSKGISGPLRRIRFTGISRLFPSTPLSGRNRSMAAPIPLMDLSSHADWEPTWLSCVSRLTETTKKH